MVLHTALDNWSGWCYILSGALMTDWFIPFLHGMNEYAPAIGACLAIVTFILNRLEKRKKV